MAKTILMPDIGGDEVNVAAVSVKEGDVVTEDTIICTVEGDKASMEVPAPEAGKIVKLLIAEGGKVKTGCPFYEIEAAEAAPAPAAAPAAAPAPEAPAAAASVETVTMPDIGNDEVNVAAVSVKEGDVVTEDTIICTVEGDKASMEVPAPKAGKIVKLLIAEGGKVKTGVPFYEVEVAGKAPAAPAAPAAAPAPAPAPADEKPAAAPAAAPAASAGTGLSQDQVEKSNAFAHAAPATRRTAREYGVDLDKVKGTGLKGRITPADVLTYIKEAVKAVQSGSVGGGSSLGGLNLLPWPKVDFTKFGEVEVKEMGRIPKISGANLHRNWVMIPHVTEFEHADITELEAFRKSQNAVAEKRKLGVKYTALVFIMKAVAKALENNPKFNASLNADASEITFKKYVNLGIAVDTPNGLVVPVIRDVNKKGVIELSKEIGEISKKAREGKLSGADMSGGCFTISSLGGIGTTYFTPIINAPEVAILGVSRSELKAVWNGKEFTPRLTLPLSLSFDHRAIDGADGARFLQAVKENLQDLRALIM